MTLDRSTTNSSEQRSKFHMYCWPLRLAGINARRKHFPEVRNVSVRSGVSGAKSFQKIAVSGLLSRFSSGEGNVNIRFYKSRRNINMVSYDSTTVDSTCDNLLLRSFAGSMP